MYNDPFISSPSQHPDEVARPAAVSLFELNSMVRAALTHTLRDCYWIVAEISELRVAVFILSLPIALYAGLDEALRSVNCSAATSYPFSAHAVAVFCFTLKRTL